MHAGHEARDAAISGQYLFRRRFRAEQGRAGIERHQAALHTAAHVLHANDLLTEVAALRPRHGNAIERRFVRVVALVEIDAEHPEAVLGQQLARVWQRAGRLARQV